MRSLRSLTNESLLVRKTPQMFSWECVDKLFGAVDAFRERPCFIGCKRRSSNFLNFALQGFRFYDILHALSGEKEGAEKLQTVKMV